MKNELLLNIMLYVFKLASTAAKANVTTRMRIMASLAAVFCKEGGKRLKPGPPCASNPTRQGGTQFLKSCDSSRVGFINVMTVS